MGLREMAEGEHGGVWPATNGEVRATEPVPASAGETDPNIPAAADVPVHVAWSRIMGEVQFIAKKDATTSGNRFTYRGVDRVVDTVAPMLRKHGVIVMPVRVKAEYTVIETKTGSAMNYCRATVTFAIIGPQGDVLSAPHPETGVMGALFGEAMGEGFDTGDKSSMKAQSVAQREFLIKALSIPVTRPQADPEHGEQYEIAGPQRRTPAQYMEEILSDTTSMQMLNQIKAELYGDRATGAAEVEMADGEKIRLVDLVLRTGRQRKNEETKA